MNPIQEMTCFAAVVEAGSFVGAVDSTGLSKAALSRHVAALEQRIGVRLLHRTTRRLSLTEDGQRFYLRATELLASLQEIEAEAVAPTAVATGVLRINAPVSFGVMHLAPLWGGYTGLHPKVMLDIALNDRLVDLVEEGYDLAVRISNLPSSQLISRKLASTRMIVCASPRYLEQHGRPNQPSQLAGHRIISYSYWSRHDEWAFTGPGGELRVRTRPCMQTSNGDTCRIAALHHQGIILQPDFLVGADLQRGDLVELMPDYRCLEIGIYAVYASRKYLPAKTRTMIDYLVESFRTPAWQ